MFRPAIRAKCNSTSTHILEVAGLSIRRGNTLILRGIDWQVDPGQHWVILGANGAGKTSLLKSITGYLAPTGGRLRLLGREYGRTDWRDLRDRIGIVTSAFASAIPPAEPALETVMSGRFAQLDLWARTTKRDRLEAQKLLGAAGIGALARREWAFLSQGERQRVLIARALMSRPEVLILDEPCAGLDPVARESFLAVIEKMARQSVGRVSCTRRSPSLVLVTHHVEEITPAFTHVLMLAAGQVIAAGPKSSTLTAQNLTRTFGAALGLQRSRNRYSLKP